MVGRVAEDECKIKNIFLFPFDTGCGILGKATPNMVQNGRKIENIVHILFFRRRKS